MQVICTDGTVFQCKDYELTDAGIMLYGEELGTGEERYEGDPDKIGYIPHDELLYVLPNGVEPAITTVSRHQRQEVAHRNQGNHRPQEGQQPIQESQQPPTQQGPRR